MGTDLPERSSKIGVQQRRSCRAGQVERRRRGKSGRRRGQPQPVRIDRSSLTASPVPVEMLGVDGDRRCGDAANAFAA